MYYNSLDNYSLIALCVEIMRGKHCQDFATQLNGFSVNNLFLYSSLLCCQ